MPEFPDPVLPGMWVHGERPGAAQDRYLKLVKQRAWELANGVQVVNTSESLKVVR